MAGGIRIGPRVRCGMGTGPLTGVRVVELGVWVAGPGAGGLLAEWGADVVKVEPPAGDPMRHLWSLTAGHGQPEVPPFDLDNRGKRSVVLDLRQPREREKALRLVDTRRRVPHEPAARRGRAARASAPSSCSSGTRGSSTRCITGYGRTGPDADRPGYDVGAFWARTGMARSLHAGGRGARRHPRRHGRPRHRARPRGGDQRRAARPRAHRARSAGRHVAAPGRDLVGRLGHRHPAAVRAAGPDPAPHPDDEPDRQPLPSR